MDVPLRCPIACWLLRIALVGVVLLGSPVAAASGSASPPTVTRAEVWLTVYRAGETRPSQGEQTDDARAEVKRGGAWVQGIVTYHLSRPAEAGDTLVLLDFAAFLQEEPMDLDEVARAMYVAGAFQAGRTELQAWWGTAAPTRQGERQDIALRLEPGATTVTLRYGVRVPRRYWPFGCLRGQCSLSGAIAPLPSEPARGGHALPADGRVVVPTVWAVKQAVLATPGDRRPVRGRKKIGRPDEVVVVADEAGRPTPYPSVFWGPAWYRERTYEAGVELEVLHPQQRPSGQVPHETLTQLRRDVPGQALAIGAEVIRLAQRLGLTPAPDTRIVIVHGPLRSAVAEAHPGVVLLSDQAFELLPVKRFVKFHQEALGRAIADTLVDAVVRNDYAPSTATWSTGTVAFALLRIWEHVRSLPDEYASDILRNFTFVPAVDRFLYTQQASFSSAYFRGVEDAPELRNHPLWYSHQLPTGRRIHEKLHDTLGQKAMDRLYRELLPGRGVDIEAAAERAYGHELDWFFDQWLGPYPSVDYALLDVRSTKVVGGYQHTIVIERRGEQPVVEPVQVLVTERGGNEHYLVWNGEVEAQDGEAVNSFAEQPRQGRHTFTLVTKAKLAHVRLDPRQRLLQEPQSPRTNVDPLFNDRTPPSFRFIYTGAGLSVAASELFNAANFVQSLNALSFFASFEGSLRRDLRRTGHIVVASNRESNLSVGTGANFWFGEKRNQRRRRARVRLFITTAWLSDRSLDPVGGVRLTERLSVSDQTQRFAWWPETGHSLSAGVTVQQVIRTEPEQDDHRVNLSVDAGWTQLWRIVHNHVIATTIAGEVVFPLVREPEFRSLTRVGGIGGLSGYAADEVFGLGVVTAQAEYRHVYVDDLGLNLAHLAYLRSIGGALFTGVSTTAGCSDYSGWFGPDSWYSHVGYGVTGRFSILGVTPQLFRVEAAVPLVRRTGVECLDLVFPDFLADRQGLDDPARLLPPFSINVLFAHPF